MYLLELAMLYLALARLSTIHAGGSNTQNYFPVANQPLSQNIMSLV
jgi:hypothetical protein